MPGGTRLKAEDLMVPMPDVDIDAAIAEATGIGGQVERVYFAGMIGNGYTDGTVEWKFEKDGLKSQWVRLPRAAFTFEREGSSIVDRRSLQEGDDQPSTINDRPLANFWLVEMARPLAEVFGIGEWVLDADEVERHRERMKL